MTVFAVVIKSQQETAALTVINAQAVVAVEVQAGQRLVRLENLNDALEMANQLRTVRAEHIEPRNTRTSWLLAKSRFCSAGSDLPVACKTHQQHERAAAQAYAWSGRSQ